MTAKRGQRRMLNDKCRAIKITSDGSTLICWKSPGHVESKLSDRREHYDPSADEYWTDGEVDA